MKWRNKKVGLSLLASVILLSSLLGYQHGLSSVPASGPYYLDVPFGTASYYVGKFDNGTTYMIDGDTWQATFWSTNDTAIFNAVVGNLSSTGGTWSIRPGDYEVHDIDLTLGEDAGGLRIIGETRSSHNNPHLGYGVTISNDATDGSPTFKIDNPPAYGQYKLEIRNLLFTEKSGGSTSGDFLHIEGLQFGLVADCTFLGGDAWAISYSNNSYFNTVERCFFYRNTGGILMNDTGNTANDMYLHDLNFMSYADDFEDGAIVAEGTAYHTIRTIKFEGLNGTGIHLKSRSGTHGVKDITIDNVLVIDTPYPDVCLKVEGISGATIGSVYVSNSQFVPPDHQTCVVLEYATDVMFDNNLFFWAPSTNGTGINIDANCEDIYVPFHANTFDISTPIVNNAGNELKDYFDFNSGTAEASNDDWIAHDLVGEPTSVVLTIEETDANYFLQLKATNATHFQIYLYDSTAGASEIVDKTINWVVEYKP